MFDGLFQPIHLVIIAIVLLLFFGPKKLPEFSRGLAESIREFKKTMAEGRETPGEPTKPSEEKK